MALSQTFNEDCLIGMRRYRDKHFDLALVDSPYGIDFAKTHTGNGWVVRPSKDWDKSIPPPEYFKEIFRISKNQIVWGGNYLIDYLYPSMGWIVWDKGQREFSLADGELAWTSFDRALRIFDYSRARLNKERGNHPTEKPVHLYKWILENYAKPGDKIIDPYMGSQSSRIACYEMGFDYEGYELDKEYFEDGEERFRKYDISGGIFRAFEEAKNDKPEITLFDEQ